MMNLLRKHWFDLGGILAIVAGIYIYTQYHDLTTIKLILWLSLISLFLHQFEEYRYPGYFPGMANAVTFKSPLPDRYPLNTQTVFLVNVVLGWTSYFLAAVFGDKCIWLAIATMMVSAGNFIIHTFVFNIQGKTIYNPGMATSILLFLPLVAWFGIYILNSDTSLTNLITGVLLGLAFNILGILKFISWMADKETHFIFENRQLRPADRITK